ncbi:hypothetical protein BBJ29_007981 [Phytophthora kernoviae]|uniref:Uncharacterized protein n=1 Tax=Phytophthora kernoviae TaxID=325452 RepID=A0A3F2RJW7_9STRA|nr:hypothetical protein BBJ29_007981 [Phytophthora kernoviae]RLN57236.1 hypothetical protein BBP00_00007610 [Phytophthora kernoviae]
MRTSRTSTNAVVAHASSGSEETTADAATNNSQFELQFNPLVALQSLISADVMSNKQRVKAAQQLENYFQRLAPTPGLLLSYEPYLPLVTEIMVTPAKGTQELQTSVLSMLQTLSSHNPYGFEKYIPRSDDDKWDEKSVEFQEFDRTFARIIQMWRTLLDHTGDEVLVSQLVKCLQSLLLQEQVDGAELWQTMLFRKLQPHFVDIADVLIGWTMNTGPINPLRESGKLSSIMKNSYKLINDNFSRLVNPQRVDAVGMLEDDIPLRDIKKGQQPKRVKVLECLFHLKCANGIKYTTQLCLLLVRIGGIDALKVR